MAVELGALREALVEAGASPAKAREAAAEVATDEQRLALLDTKMNLVMWMTGATLAGLGGVGWLVLRLAAKAGVI